jgi:hypothetical protein
MLVASAAVDVGVATPHAQSTSVVSKTSSPVPSKAVVDRYCATCHNQRLKTGGLALDGFDLADIGAHAREWEKAVVKLRAGLMPPADAPRPDKSTLDAFTTWLEDELDRAAAANPNPGRTEPFHRLNRAEYQNAVRDLLGIDIDTTAMLPADEVSYGFDNIAGVLKLSPLLTERYLNAAQKVARLALGAPGPAGGEMFRVPDQLDQDVRLEGMPVGTRGGKLVHFLAPRDGEYVIKTRLARGLDEDIPHFLGDQHLEVSVDGERLKVFTLDATPGDLNVERQVFSAAKPNTERAGAQLNDQPAQANARGEKVLARRSLDDDWVVRVPLKAGMHDIRAAFLMKTNALPEGFRRPFLKPYIGRGIEDTRETREGASLRTIEIMGPLNGLGAEESPSHRRVFTCHPVKASEEMGCARTILSTLARRAYRRPVNDTDLKVLLDFYNDGRAEGGFEAGIELAVERLLVSPSFLFRVEVPPARVGSDAPSGAYRISDIELASRLSFFLWSSIPDDQLLGLAADNKLRNPTVLEQQVRRMLKDPRSQALIKNFAGQWLYLRKLPDIVPDPFLFPDHGDTLALAFERETELFFDSVLREDRPAIELLTANYTFVNERLAKHYDIPNVKGINFRRIALPEDSPRRGLLGKGSILSVTAFPNRTSPVVRGKWILDNLLGAPPPEPPPNVPALAENGDKVTKVLTMRQRMEAHRSNPACAGCHKLMDPLGFALENFDAIGKFRVYDEDFQPIDNAGVYPDGTKFEGVAGLRQLLVSHPDRLLASVTTKLMTYALGRGVEYYDAPAIRSILRDAAPREYRLQSLILGIIKSAPFQMRRLES